MKTVLSFLGFFLLLTGIQAQTTAVKKVYAYRQYLLQGKKPVQYETVKKSERFFIYLEVSKNKKLNVTGMWIDNSYYRFSVKRYSKTPVVIKITEGPEKFIAVPKTLNDIYEVIPGKKQEPAPRPGTTLGNYLQKNEVVIIYSYKGKQYFAGVEKMTLLESMPMM